MVKLMGGKRQRTRERLIEITAALVRERGLGGVTLEEVAARAGMTKGAIYSSFRSKAELLWAAVDERRLHLRPQFTPGDPLAQARETAKALMAQMPQAEREAAFYAELSSQVRADPELHAQQAAQQKAQLDWIADQLEANFGDQLAYPPRAVALAVQAMALGLLAQWERTPDEVDEAGVVAAFEVLALGATRGGA